MPWSKDNLPDAVKNKDWSDAQIEQFVKTANAILEETGDDGRAISVAISQIEKSNQLAEGMTLKDIAEKHSVPLEELEKQYKIGLDVEQEHGDEEQAGRIALDHLFEDANYYSKLKKMEKKNAKQFPKVFYAKHMETGLAGYSDETILIDTDNLKSMIPTFVGKPVYVYHQDVDLSTMKEKAAGYVTDSFYNELDGWLWVKFIAVDDEAQDVIAKGWSVSNAYIPTEWGAGGTHHNCPYDRKIIGGEFTHLAIVPDPRYEEAKIYSPEDYKSYQEQKRRVLDEVHNSKGETKKEGKFMFKLFKTQKEEVASVDEDTMVELQNGMTVSVKEMLNAMKKNEADMGEEKKKEEKEESEEAKEEKAKENAEGDFSEKDMEIINRYLAMKKNEAEKGKEEDKEEKEDEKTNSKYFDELKNAHETAEQHTVHVLETSMDKLARGKARYGSN